MLNRLRRPGYWIVALALLTVYFYHAYQKREERERREALFHLYQSYGTDLIASLGAKEFEKVRSLFAPERGTKRLSLEDIALFVTTAHLEKGHSSQWKSFEENESAATLHGILNLEGNLSYPMDLMLVKRGGKVLLKRFKIGGKTLELRPSMFPLNTLYEANATAIRK